VNGDVVLVAIEMGVVGGLKFPAMEDALFGKGEDRCLS
jgi:hypothetical protein